MNGAKQAATVIASVLLAACMGTIGDDDGFGGGRRRGGGESGGVDSKGESLTCTTPAVGPTPMRRLTRGEYDNAVRDLLGDTRGLAKDFAADTQVGLFDNTASTQTVPELLAEQFLNSAAQLAEGVSDVQALLGCAPASASDACVKSFVERFGRRVYRRPLDADEVTRLIAIFDATKAAEDAETAVRGVVTALLASPNFLFRPEFGDGTATLPNATRATPWEIASRLSFLLWGSVPDDTLLDAAAKGELGSREQIATQARRMLDDDKAKSAIYAFYDQWLGMNRLAATAKAPEVYPDFDDRLRASMLEESHRFVSDVLWKGDARLSTLLRANYTFVDGALAKLYGVDAPSGGSFSRVELPRERAGILTQASLLTAFARADDSSPVKRGAWVRERLLCDELPAPPANVPVLPPPKEGTSNREALEAHTSDPACNGCHKLIDPAGFTFENYDGVGHYRTTSNGAPVDATAQITGTQDVDGDYENVVAFAAKLATSAEVHDCVALQWTRYAMARHEVDEDACSVAPVREAFAKSGGDLRELMIALTQTDAFTNVRKAE